MCLGYPCLKMCYFLRKKFLLVYSFLLRSINIKANWEKVECPFLMTSQSRTLSPSIHASCLDLSVIWQRISYVLLCSTTELCFNSFQALHGFSPSEALEGTLVKTYATPYGKCLRHNLLYVVIASLFLWALHKDQMWCHRWQKWEQDA